MTDINSKIINNKVNEFKNSNSNKFNHQEKEAYKLLALIEQDIGWETLIDLKEKIFLFGGMVYFEDPSSKFFIPTQNKNSFINTKLEEEHKEERRQKLNQNLPQKLKLKSYKSNSIIKEEISKKTQNNVEDKENDNSNPEKTSEGLNQNASIEQLIIKLGIRNSFKIDQILNILFYDLSNLYQWENQNGKVYLK